MAKVFGYIPSKNTLKALGAKLEQSPMKLYHKNTDVEVKVGDVFHLSGKNCKYKYCNAFADAAFLTFASGWLYVHLESLCMEWR